MAVSSIFKAFSSEGFQIVTATSLKGSEYLHTHLDGTPRTGVWYPLPVEICAHGDNHELLKPFDVSGIGSPGTVLTLTRAAVDRLGGFLRDYGELLPLLCEETELYVFNPTTVVDALDIHASEMARIKQTGRIYGVWTHVFRPECLGNADIFRIPELRGGPTFFSQRAVAILRASELRGIEFQEVWKTKTSPET